MFDCENKPIVDFKESEESEFKKGDVIIRINGHIPAKILRVDEHQYYLRWMVGGDSMLWIDDVDKEYVRIDHET